MEIVLFFNFNSFNASKNFYIKCDFYFYDTKQIYKNEIIFFISFKFIFLYGSKFKNSYL